MKKEQQRLLNDMIDLKEDQAIKNLALAKILSQEHALYSDIDKWKNTTPNLGLDQSMIDSVIARLDKQLDILNYIENKIKVKN